MIGELGWLLLLIFVCFILLSVLKFVYEYVVQRCQMPRPTPEHIEPPILHADDFSVSHDAISVD